MAKNFVIPKDSIRLDTSHSFKAGKGFQPPEDHPAKGRTQPERPPKQRRQANAQLWVMDGFSGGFALRDENLLTVARTAWWRDTEKTEPKSCRH